MIDKSLFKLFGIRKTMLLLVGYTLGAAVCILGEAITLARALSALWNGESLEDQLVFIAIFFVCLVLKQVLFTLQDAFLDTYAATRATELRQAVLEQIFSTRVQVVRENGTASIATALLEGVDQVETYLRIILPKIVGVVILPLACLILIFFLDMISGIILLVAFPVVILFMSLIGSFAQERAERRYGSFQIMSNHFIDTLRGIETLKVFGASKDYESHIFATSERFRKATIRTIAMATLSSAVLDFAATASTAAVAILLGFRLLSGDIGLFAGLTVLILCPEYFKPLRNFADDFHASLDGKNALAHLTSLISHATSKTEQSDTSRPAQSAAQSSTSRTTQSTAQSSTSRTTQSTEQPITSRTTPQKESDGRTNHSSSTSDSRATVHHRPPCSTSTIPSPASWTDSSTLTLKELTYSYPLIDNSLSSETPPPALTDISLELKGFTKFGVIGASGAGKSTLASLIAGFITPDGGTITFNEQHVSTLGIPAWQNNVLYIPQNPYIFHASVRENICFYTPNASAEAVERAVCTMGLEPLVEELPHGLDTIIGDAGRELSGGQIQRIALARVLLDSSRRILVFDEPTAHLDIETEYELKQRMMPLMENRLVIFATHRLHWLSSMDSIVILDEGRIAEMGTLNALLHPKGALSHLRAQGMCLKGRS